MHFHSLLHFVGKQFAIKFWAMKDMQSVYRTHNSYTFQPRENARFHESGKSAL